MKYHHGGDIYTNQAELDYSANINPLGLPEGVKRAVIDAMDELSCYPDSASGKLRERLGTFHQVPAECIICGNGAADLIFQVVQAVKPKEALLLAPSFSEYEQALRAEGSQITYYDLKEEAGFTLSIDGLCDYIKENSSQQPDILFLCNPNNPTGLVVPKDSMGQLLELCEKKGILCVMDECFNEFLEKPEDYSILEELRTGRYEQLFLLKAFTKIYAMAGIRLGYGICYNTSLLEQMQMVRQPWSVSGPAQTAGVAALKETEYVTRTRDVIGTERRFLKKRMEELGLFVYESMANYLFFKDQAAEGSPETERELYDKCLERGILIRSCGNYRGLNNRYYRICVKQRAENERFLSVLQSVLEERK